MIAAPLIFVVLIFGSAPADDAILRQFDVSNSVYSLAFSPDGALLAAQVGSRIHVWDTTTGKEVRKIIEEPSPGIWSVAFSADGKSVYAPLQDNTIASWNVATGKLGLLFKGHTSTVWWSAVSPDGKLLASGGEDRTIRLWKTATGTQLFQLEHTSGVWPFLFTDDGKELVSIASDGTLYIWDVKDRKARKRFPIEPGVWPLGLSSNGWTAATVRWQGTTIRLWDLRSGKELRNLEMQPGTGWNVAFAPDGRTLAAGGPNNSLCLWETMTGQQRLHVQVRNDRIDALAWSPDGRKIAVAGSDGKIDLCDVIGRPKTGRLAATQLTAAGLDALWKDLSANRGADAHKAIWTLIAAGDRAVAFLEERIKRIVPTPVDADKVEEWLRNLDDDSFEVREKASTELEKLASAVRPALQKSLETGGSLERKRRLNELLGKLDQGVLSPDVLAACRAVEVLEQIATPNARRALEKIITSKTASEVKEEIVLSLRRLSRRKQPA